jgi:hypothetical protein
MHTKTELTSEQKRMYADQVRKMKSIFTSGGCMFTGATCSASPIRSHTISRSRYLENVAENNQVLRWKTDHWAEDTTSLFDLRADYTNEATTFPGFCSQHDGALFRCLDDCEFMATPEQLFMLAYRTHSREVHCKKAQILTYPQPEDVARLHGDPEPEKAVHSLFGALNLESAQVGERDTLIHHARLQAVLLSQDFRRLCSCIVPFDFPAQPFIATAGSFFPDFDAHGKEVQDFGDALAVLNSIHYSILPTSGKSFAIFSYLDTEPQGPRQLIDSILASPRLGDLIAWMAFVYIENTAIRPSWWQSLSGTTKAEIHAAFHSNVDPLTPMVPNLSRCPTAFTSGIRPDRPFWI